MSARQWIVDDECIKEYVEKFGFCSNCTMRNIQILGWNYCDTRKTDADIELRCRFCDERFMTQIEFGVG